MVAKDDTFSTTLIQSQITTKQLAVRVTTLVLQPSLD